MTVSDARTERRTAGPLAAPATTHAVEAITAMMLRIVRGGMGGFVSRKLLLAYHLRASASSHAGQVREAAILQTRGYKSLRNLACVTREYRRCTGPIFALV